jgi:hypothetical protein
LSGWSTLFLPFSTGMWYFEQRSQHGGAALESMAEELNAQTLPRDSSRRRRRAQFCCRTGVRVGVVPLISMATEWWIVST